MTSIYDLQQKIEEPTVVRKRYGDLFIVGGDPEKLNYEIRVERKTFDAMFYDGTEFLMEYETIRDYHVLNRLLQICNNNQNWTRDVQANHAMIAKEMATPESVKVIKEAHTRQKDRMQEAIVRVDLEGRLKTKVLFALIGKKEAQKVFDKIDKERDRIMTAKGNDMLKRVEYSAEFEEFLAGIKEWVGNSETTK